jgi:hypothetical protein
LVSKFPLSGAVDFPVDGAVYFQGRKVKRMLRNFGLIPVGANAVVEQIRGNFQSRRQMSGSIINFLTGAGPFKAPGGGSHPTRFEV